MKDMLKIIVRVINIASICGLFLFVILGAVGEIIGYSKMNKVLSYIGISNDIRFYWISAIILLIIMGITFFIEEKW